MKMQINIITTYHYAYQNSLKLIKSNNSKCWQECEETVILMQSQFSSVAQPCLALCDPMNYSTPDLPVHHQLPEFTQTHVH